MSAPLLICTDLDGTLIPDGRAAESPEARTAFARCVERPEVSLAYVTGRHRALIEEAIAEFSLPVPDFVIGDVGTSIYDVAGAEWVAAAQWDEALQAQWEPETPHRLRSALEGPCFLQLQDETRQGRFKLSYDVAPEVDGEEVLAQSRRQLEALEVEVRLIFSRDSQGVGLLDVVPSSAGKLPAIDFLINRGRFRPERFLFAGDSGNDMDVFVSPLPAVVVANASATVRERAQRIARDRGLSAKLYLAQTGPLGMNGNYSAGILQGLVHFVSESEEWLS